MGTHQAHVAAASINQTVGAWEANERRIRAIIARHGFPDPDESVEDKFALNGRRGQQPPEPEQATLF